MKPEPKCVCSVPVLVERAERKGASKGHCARCKRPFGLRLAALRPTA